MDDGAEVNALDGTDAAADAPPADADGPLPLALALDGAAEVDSDTDSEWMPFDVRISPGHALRCACAASHADHRCNSRAYQLARTTQPRRAPQRGYCGLGPSCI